MKKKLSAVLLAGVLAIATLTGCSSSSSSDVQTTGATEPVDSSTSSGTFTVGFDQDFPPMGFVDEETGEYTGFDLALAAEVANRLGLEIKYQPIAWDAKDMELSSGTIDCIWNGFTMNGREDSYTWTDAYMKNDQVFVVRKDSGIASSADLAGKLVDVQADSSAEAALKENEELSNSFGQLITVADYNTAFMELESGAVDAIAMDNTVASYQIEKRNADFVVLDESIAAEEYGIGFKKGNTELRDKVQAALEEMAADGTMAKISTEWFGKDITIIGK
jgi:polar amino acid transport system substrate-binding protein